jgi:hypothetical protein
LINQPSCSSLSQAKKTSLFFSSDVEPISKFWGLEKSKPRPHSMLRLDARTKKRYVGKLFKFKKFSIKQAFFINEIFSSRVKAVKQKKIEVFFCCFFKGF